MAQKTDQQQEPAGSARARGTQQGGDQTQQMEAAANRIGDAARTGAQAGGDALREGGQDIARGTAETARSTQRTAQIGGEAARRGIEDMGEGIRDIAETGADQFDRMGEMMADAARDAAESVRMMMSLSTMATDNLRGMQNASNGLFERLFQTNMRVAQSLVQQANPGEFASLQQRFIRQYMEAMVQGSEELLRAAQHMTDEALRPIEQMRSRSNGQRQQRHQQQRGRGESQAPKVSDVMSRDVRLIRPDDTVQQAARLMGEGDTGVLPVAEGDRLVGMLTDRDIAIRVAAQGRDPANTPVRDAMTREVKYCFEDEDIDRVADNMAEQQLHRLPVMNRQKRLVGIVSLGDLAERGQQQFAGRALAGISRHTDRHSQSAEARTA